MRRQRALRVSLAVGLAGAVVGAGYGVATGAIPDSTGAGVPGVALFLAAAMLTVPFSLAATAAYLALRHRVLVPLVAVVGFLVAAVVVVPTLPGWHSGQVVVGVLVLGPMVAVLALLEVLGRATVGRLAAPPSRVGWQALSVGVMAALGYLGVFALRAALPLWRIDTGVPSRLPPTLDMAVLLWYVLGSALLLVGLPVALNRRFGLLAPGVGLLSFLAVDLAFVQPAVATGNALVVALLVGIWPTLAVTFVGCGVLEWWLRLRRGGSGRNGPGPGEDGPEADTEDGGVTVESGVFGDRV